MLHLISSLALTVSGLIPADMPIILNGLSLPPQTRQVIIVSSKGWSEPVGQMARFVLGANGWEPDGAATAIVLGTKGMGWGRGLHQAGTTGPHKAEGDGRAPAGVFSLGTAFGYAASPPQGARWSYTASTAQDYFVDDANSPEYNQWVRLAADAAPARRWASFERMRRQDGLYELGIVVNHNTSPAMTGKGSAIFMHVWRASNKGTSGCTAMPLDQMASLMQWLDPQKQPLLIQMPQDQFASLRLK